MKKIIIFLCIFILSSTSALAMTDDEMMIGICSTIYPIGNFSKQITCTKKGNQTICRKTYRPETIKTCKTMFYQMGLLKPGESPRVLLNRLLSAGDDREKQRAIDDAKTIKLIQNSFYDF